MCRNKEKRFILRGKESACSNTSGLQLSQHSTVQLLVMFGLSLYFKGTEVGVLSHWNQSAIIGYPFSF